MIKMSRKEAIKTIQEFYYPILSAFWLDEKKDVLANALEMAIEALKEERPHGEWIIIDDCEKFIARCSVCGRILDSRMVKDYPFCRCGADMRGAKK